MVKKIKKMVGAYFRKYWVSSIIFLLMAIFLIESGSMVNTSGDAASIWETIKSYYSDKIVSSYVLYKGFASVYPYVWFRELSIFFNLGEFFFIKVYHCLLFTYVSTIGIPYCIEKITKIKIKNYRVLILSIVLLIFWSSNAALTQLMIDLPSLAFFILLVNSVLRIAEGRKKIIIYLYSGLLAGLCCCLSGQYILAVLFLIIFMLIKTFSKEIFKNKRQLFNVLLCIMIFFLSFFAIKTTNAVFENKVTNVLRTEGEWIPTGDTWMSIGYLRFIDITRVTGTKIIDNRGYAIIKDYFSENSNFEETYNSIKNGGVSLSMKEYFKMVSKYPFDFAIKYVNRIYVSLSPDVGKFNFFSLFAGYTLFYISLIVMIRNVKSIKQFFSPNILIILSFIMALAAIVVLTVEMRYAMQLQGLIYGVAILSNELWDGLKAFWRTIKRIISEKSFKFLGNARMPYILVIYILFMCLCFAHMGSLYEANGMDSNTILVNFDWRIFK